MGGKEASGGCIPTVGPAGLRQLRSSAAGALAGASIQPLEYGGYRSKRRSPLVESSDLRMLAMGPSKPMTVTSGTIIRAVKSHDVEVFRPITVIPITYANG